MDQPTDRWSVNIVRTQVGMVCRYEGVPIDLHNLTDLKKKRKRKAVDHPGGMWQF